MSLSTIILDPHDPLVFGDGREPPALAAAPSAQWPLPSVVAGFARATLAHDPTWRAAERLPAPDGRVSAEVAARLLSGVTVRGPWLAAPGTPAPLWIAAPADVVMLGAKGQEGLARATLSAPRAGEGTLTPSRAALPLLVDLPDRDPDAPEIKSRDLPFPMWPLEAALSHSLDASILISPIPGLFKEERPYLPEARVHVSIDDHSGAAERDMLFTRVGVRFRDGWKIAFELEASSAGPQAGLGVLGGESRAVFRDVQPGPCFPAFPKQKYAAAWKTMSGTATQVLLRVQLVTPGCFGGWRPLDEGPLKGLTLQAAMVPRYTALSGWDLQRQAPRGVRRLVPAGAVYWFAVPPTLDPVLIAERLWKNPLPGVLPAGEQNLNLPQLDGFNQVLPGFTPAP